MDRTDMSNEVQPDRLTLLTFNKVNPELSELYTQVKLMNVTLSICSYLEM